MLDTAPSGDSFAMRTSIFSPLLSVSKQPAAAPKSSLPTRVWLIVVTCLSLATTSQLQATDWLDFRGPTGQGHAPSGQLPEQLEPSRATWKTAVAGKGWSSPLVVKNQILLTTAVPEPADMPTAQSLRVLSFDATSGVLQWNVEVFRKSMESDLHSHAKNSFASPSAVSDGERLFAHFGPDGTACLSLDGDVSWKTDSLRYNPQHGAGGSPVLFDDVLVLNGDGVDDPFVAAVSCESGQIAWKTPRPEMPAPRWSFCTPLVIETAGQQQLISPASHMACAYDPQTGDELWRVRYPNKWSVVPRPVFAHGLVFLCTGYDGPAELLAVRPDGRGDVTDTHVAWRTDEQVPHNPSPLIIDDAIYLISDNGIASCRDALTGTLHWRQRLGGDFSASPLFADGRIYAFNEQGECFVFAAEHAYRELASSDFEETVFASPAVSDGAIFIRTEGHLYRFDRPPARDGN
jgi:outer membrane protein assembly factor BamB